MNGAPTVHDAPCRGAMYRALFDGDAFDLLHGKRLLGNRQGAKTPRKAKREEAEASRGASAFVICASVHLARGFGGGASGKSGNGCHQLSRLSGKTGFEGPEIRPPSTKSGSRCHKMSRLSRKTGSWCHKMSQPSGKSGSRSHEIRKPGTQTGSGSHFFRPRLRETGSTSRLGRPRPLQVRFEGGHGHLRAFVGGSRSRIFRFEARFGGWGDEPFRGRGRWGSFALGGERFEIGGAVSKASVRCSIRRISKGFTDPSCICEYRPH